MKKIKKLSLSNVIEKLTRNEMRYVMAGTGYSTTCYSSDETCYTDDKGVKYVCSGPPEPESEADCCCGHDEGNSNCVMG